MPNKATIDFDALPTASGITLKSVKIMNKRCSLNKLPAGKSAVVRAINCKESLKNRIYDFGITENSVVTALFKSPFGDPAAYSIKNAVVALRNSDSENIIVTVL